MTDGLHGASLGDVEHRVEELEAENQELRALVEALHTKINHLEDQIDTDGGATGGGSGATVDHYDKAVLETLDAQAPLAVTTPALQKLYRSQTTLRNNKTIKRRVRTLTDHDAFELLDTGRWHYHGRQDGGDSNE